MNNQNELLVKYKENKKSFISKLRNHYKRNGSKAYIIYNDLVELFGQEFELKDTGYMFYHYENGLDYNNPDVPLCQLCKEKRVKFNSYNTGYSKWCSPICCRRDSSKVSREKQLETCRKIHEFNRKNYADPSSNIRQQLSLASRNYWHNSPTSDDRRKEASDRMKAMIADGVITPNITNTWTRWKIEINGKKFRSSFEGVFHLSYPLLEYEKTRIPYTYGGKSHTYIVDFTDVDNKIIYEIKPTSLKESGRNLSKFEHAIRWCKDNDYTFEVITEDEIFKLAAQLPDDNDFIIEFKRRYKCKLSN